MAAGLEGLPYHDFRAVKRGTEVPLSTTTMKGWSGLLCFAAAGDEEQNQTAECHEGVGGGFGDDAQIVDRDIHAFVPISGRKKCETGNR